MAAVESCRQHGTNDRCEILQKLASIPGVYVPGLYKIEYNADGTIASMTPKIRAVPERIEKRNVDLEQAAYPEKPLVPFVHAIHDRLNIEIARGCIHRCRFCQASRAHAPVRQRSVEKVLDLAEKGLTATGFESLSLTALS